MDYFLEHPEALKGQPKKTIGDYVEQKGILVAKRFETLEEGRKSHKGLFLRSEHTQEYDGVSGLLDSFKLGKKYYQARGLSDIDKIKEKYFEIEKKELGVPKFEQYCIYLGLDIEEFKKQTSFSIWEHLDGVNHSLIADSAIPGRYHLMSYGKDSEKWVGTYSIIENEKTLQELHIPLTDNLRNQIPNLIEIYETVRDLEKFDSDHCPIMEFQYSKGKNYFLQYHRATDFSPSKFELDRAPEKGEIEVSFVRGATPKEGIDCKVTVYYSPKGKQELKDPEDEEGSFDFHFAHLFSELRVRERNLQITTTDDIGFEMFKYIVEHAPKSQLFKPKTSIILAEDLSHKLLRNNEVICYSFGNESKYYPKDPVLKKEEKIFNFWKEAQKTGHNSFMNIHIVSDGRKAFIKRI